MIIKYRNFTEHFVRGMLEKLARHLASWHVKLKTWHAIWHVGMPYGTLTRLLTRWHVKARSWHALTTVARKHVGT